MTYPLHTKFVASSRRITRKLGIRAQRQSMVLVGAGSGDIL